MNYTFHQLRIFKKVAEMQSVTKAAEELHLTQPAVSIQLKNLQDQFDIPLTEVVGRKLYITEFGKELAEFCSAILEKASEIENKRMSYLGYLSGKLTISTVSTAKYVMPFFLGEFLKIHPGIELSMDVTNKGRVVNDLEENMVDFSMVSILPPQLSLNKLELMENKLFLVGSPSLNWKGKLSTKLDRITTPLILREEGSATRQAMEGYLRKKGIHPKKPLRLTSNEAVKQAVIAGLGVSIMPLIGIRNEIRNGDLQIIKTPGLPISTTWNIVWLKNKNLGPAAKTFLEYLRDNRASLIDKHFAWIRDY